MPSFGGVRTAVALVTRAARTPWLRRLRITGEEGSSGARGRAHGVQEGAQAAELAQGRLGWRPLLRRQISEKASASRRTGSSASTPGSRSTSSLPSSDSLIAGAGAAPDGRSASSRPDSLAITCSRTMLGIVDGVTSSLLPWRSVICWPTSSATSWPCTRPVSMTAAARTGAAPAATVSLARAPTACRCASRRSGRRLRVVSCSDTVPGGPAGGWPPSSARSAAVELLRRRCAEARAAPCCCGRRRRRALRQRGAQRLGEALAHHLRQRACAGRSGIRQRARSARRRAGTMPGGEKRRRSRRSCCSAAWVAMRSSAWRHRLRRRAPRQARRGADLEIAAQTRSDAPAQGLGQRLRTRPRRRPRRPAGRWRRAAPGRSPAHRARAPAARPRSRAMRSKRRRNPARFRQRLAGRAPSRRGWR